MGHPTARVLGTLELLQAHGRIAGSELARRLGVAPRTVRRYVRALEELGIPITADLGRNGGYGLVAGWKLPPMLFTDEEAFALSLGLLAGRALGLARAAPGLASAQAKLERVMPAALRGRLRAADATMALDLPPVQAAADAARIATLADAAQNETAVHIRYVAADGTASERRLDPYGLAYRGGRWYVVGHCHLRAGRRSFRVDRIDRLETLAARFSRPPDFDTLADLTRALATLRRTHQVELILRTSFDVARDQPLVRMGRLDPDPSGAGRRSDDRRLRLLVEADDLDWLARELARLPFPFEVRRPTALRAALSRHARRLSRIARESPRARRAR